MIYKVAFKGTLYTLNYIFLFEYFIKHFNILITGFQKKSDLIKRKWFYYGTIEKNIFLKRKKNEKSLKAHFF